MVYLDTSFVAPLVIAENSSDAVEAFVLKVKHGELTTSMWTQVELSSLVSRKVRMGEYRIPSHLWFLGRVCVLDAP